MTTGFQIQQIKKKKSAWKTRRCHFLHSSLCNDGQSPLGFCEPCAAQTGGAQTPLGSRQQPSIASALEPPQSCSSWELLLHPGLPQTPTALQMLQMLQALQMLLPRCARAPRSKARKGCGKGTGPGAQRWPWGRESNGRAGGADEAKALPALAREHTAPVPRTGTPSLTPIPPTLSQVPVRFLPTDLGSNQVRRIDEA